MHKQQKDFCKSVQALHPQYFKNRNVLDAGSLDVNGNNRYLFSQCSYIGVDIIKGNNVDVLSHIHKYMPQVRPEVIISTEMLEHDQYWRKSITHMYDILAPGGLLLITCATVGRKEHGTRRTEEHSSPATPYYYRNISEQMFLDAIADCMFSDSVLQSNTISHDLYFWGIKDGI